MHSTRPETVHVVHCVDTEGPLCESLSDTFERLRYIFGIEIEPTRENLIRLQRGDVDLGGLEDDVARIVAPDLLAYNESWDDIEAMWGRILTPEFRGRFPDSFGRGWRYTWFLVDHVGFDANPRRRDLGWHRIWDRYHEALQHFGIEEDELAMHHHPVPFSRSAHHSSTAFFNHTPIIFEILARKILERDWFPSAARPGFHAVRPDSHWFLEQHIPFDFGNQSMVGSATGQPDVSNGRFGDWRRAPSHWTPYHPDHDDYQRPGSCRRWVARSLNVGTRHSLLSEEDVKAAFAQARRGEPTVLSFTHHDFRDMEPDVDTVQRYLRSAAAEYPDVPFRWCTASEAMRRAMDLPDTDPLRPWQRLEGDTLSLGTDRSIFGPQPFFAIRTRDGRFLSDNLDFQGGDRRRWSYVFDEQSVPLERVETIGWAANDASGRTAVVRLDVESGSTSITHH